MFDINMAIGIEKKTGTGIGGINDIQMTMEKLKIKDAFVSSLFDTAPDLCSGKHIYEYFDRSYDHIHPLPVWTGSENVDVFFDKIKKYNGKSFIIANSLCKERLYTNFSDLISRALQYGIKAIFLPIKANYSIQQRLNGWNDIYMLCKTFASMNFIATGMNRSDSGDLLLKLFECETLYADVGNLHTATIIERLTDQGYTDRLLLGSGYGISYPTAFLDHVLYSDISDAAKDRIIFHNAEKLFKL